MSVPTLSPLEARVLGVLVEKQHTVPDTYPLTLNALLSGCNQKTSRNPVLSASESEVLLALDRLRGEAWIVETSGGRVMRYAHNVERVLAIPTQSTALLAALMLRGPQTSAELRANAERLHRFADVSAVEAFLHELEQRPAGALVVELPRTPGTRETRWAERLSGNGIPPDVPAKPRSFTEGHASAEAFDAEEIRARVDARAGADAQTAAESSKREIESLRSELQDLRHDLDRLGATVAELAARLTSDPPQA